MADWKGLRLRVLRVRDPEYPYYAQFSCNGLDYWVCGKFKEIDAAKACVDDLREATSTFTPMPLAVVYRYPQ